MKNSPDSIPVRISALAKSSCLLILFVCATSLVLAGETHSIPLNPEEGRLRVNGPKGLKTEVIPEGGIRLTYQLDEATKKRGAITLTYEFEQPVNATVMNFELKQAQAEKLVGSCRLQNGKNLTKVVDSLGPELLMYAVDFAVVASEAGVGITPLTTVTLRFRANAEAGEQTVELRRWWME